MSSHYHVRDGKVDMIDPFSLVPGYYSLETGYFVPADARLKSVNLQVEEAPTGESHQTKLQKFD